MSKAILVIDIKKRVNGKYICFDEDYTCPFFNKKEWGCLYKFNTNAKVCPLKELPKPIQIPSDLPDYAHYTKGYDDGWNACIGEILGEEMTDKQFRYIVIEGYTDGIWYVIDTFENGKVIREFKDQRPLAYDYCEKLNRKAKK